MKTKKQRNRERREKLEREAAARHREKQEQTYHKKPNKWAVPWNDHIKVTIEPPKPWRPDQPHYPSLNGGVAPAHTSTVRPRYEGEMLDRELKAKEEIERKKTQVAPLYNKGGYMYITEGTNPRDIGRKTSEIS